MHRTRAFTIFEMMTVMVVATILTTIGMVGVSRMIRESRYKSDRARLYKDVKEARDRAKKGMYFLTIASDPTQPAGYRTRVMYKLNPLMCSGPTLPPPLSWTIDYPSIDTNGDDMMCINASGATTAPPSNEIKFQPVDPENPAAWIANGDTIYRRGDGSLFDDWGEFPDEGCLEGNPSGDPDDGAMECGDP